MRVRNILSAIALSFVTGVTIGQPVGKNVLVEHFTNTYCSICASRNPGFYSNLFQFPQAMHIAYYPSAPYPACPLNQHNTAENDSRTNFYGIYGATPRIVIQGNVISANTNYGDSTIFKNVLGQTTAFDVKMSMQQLTPNTIEVRAVIIKRDTSSLQALQLYGVIVEDTLLFNANNGETIHYDVFRKSVWTSPSMSVTMPVNVGDSIVYTQSIPTSSSWDLGRVYSIGILQDGNNNLVQAGKSNHLSVAVGVNELNENNVFEVYPNPASDHLSLSLKTDAKTSVMITDLKGSILSTQHFSKKDISIDVSGLAPGLYFIKTLGDGMCHQTRFVKY
jgi:hypothetical protein